MAKKKFLGKQKDALSETSGLYRFFTSDATHFITGLIVLMFTVYATISVISFFFTGAADQSRIEGLSFFHWGRIDGIENWTGTRGAILSDILLNRWFGVSVVFLLFFFALVALRLMKARYINLVKQFILCSVLTIWGSLALSFFLGSLFKNTVVYIGGGHGYLLSDWMVANFGIPGTFLIILILFVIIMAVISSRTIPFLRTLFKLKRKERFMKPASSENLSKPEIEDVLQNPVIQENESKMDDDFEVIVAKDEDSQSTTSPIGQTDNSFVEIQKDDENQMDRPISGDEDESGKLLEELGVYDPRADLSHYQFPTLDLLQKSNQGDAQVDMAEQTGNKNRIIQTLENYGIKIKSIKATVGPTVTLYEIVPEDGIRISKIRNLEDDIAMSLSALGIRIIAPMPGKGTVGIEVPNRDRQIVYMQSIMASRKFQESKYELPIALGRTITNEVFMIDLTKMPHLLVAGATGQGKSVGLNVAITSLLYKKHPSELKFVLIDPKMVEFSIYSVIERHFLAKLPDAEKPIITDFTKVIYTLNSLTKEMDDRYALLEKVGSRNVKEYNEKFVLRRLNPEKGHRYMPYIVVIIDEFGDLIMTAGKEIEQPIARIAQKARAVGIHMIIATQRPTTNIITGTIKANFPARIAFRVISMIDSRTILDGPGANQLIGKGDLLFTEGNDKTRIQCAFVDTPEVERISKFVGSQQAYPTAYILPEYVGDEGEKSLEGIDLSRRDPLFDDAARLIVMHQQGSTSLIQRKFEVGYNRAGRLMDQLEKAGIVGPVQGSKPREVYIQDEYRLEQLLNTLKT
jgi:S-DNA-T family DNA segregation ATPase FtsK/SpoIIIE